MNSEPTNEELREFVGSLLSNFDQLASDPEVIDEAIGLHREMWVMLYRASLGFNDAEA